MIYGDYVGGDYDSPNAPWNERYVTCPLCNGKGFHFWAFCLRTREEIEVTEATYACLPDNEDVADSLGQHYCKADDGIRYCPLCEGEKKVNERAAREYHNL